LRPGHAPAIHVEVIFVQILPKIAVLLAMSIAGALSMDIMSLQIRLEHLVILNAYRHTVNLQSINAALVVAPAITIVEIADATSTKIAIWIIYVASTCLAIVVISDARTGDVQVRV
jgi:hypothetical protein